MTPHLLPCSAPGSASAGPLRAEPLRAPFLRAGAGLLAGVLAGLCLAGLHPAEAAPSLENMPGRASAGQARDAVPAGHAGDAGAASPVPAKENSVPKNVFLPGTPLPDSPSAASAQAASGTPSPAAQLPAGQPAAGQGQLRPADGAQAPSGDGERALRDQLLEESIERLLPLEPGEIRTYLERRDSVEGAIQPGPARMRTETRKISAVPGAAPQVIRLTAGYSSTLIFQDASGAPWPVDAVILGDAKAFQASQPGLPAGARDGRDQASRASRSGDGGEGGAQAAGHANLVTLVPLTNHASSNLVVTLEGAPYPVILHLLTESSAKQARIEDALVVFRLDTPGPRAPLPAVGPAQPGPVTRELLNLVHGIPPEGASRLRLEPELWGTDLWECGGRRYLRTGHQPVWPAWSSQAGQAVKVYVMPKTPGIVLSVNGRRVPLAVEGRRERQGGRP